MHLQAVVIAIGSVVQGLEELSGRGVLLLTDPKRASLAGLIAGAPIRGSWWSHPKGDEIFRAASELEDHPDVTTAKLIDGKVTFIHRALFSALVTVGLAREAWQLDALSDDAKALLDQVDALRVLRASGAAVKELEKVLLVASRQVHTESGKHVLELCTWETFAAERGVRRGEVAEAKAAFEAVAERLPWQAARKRRR